jgi:hypothetical protein
LNKNKNDIGVEKKEYSPCVRTHGWMVVSKIADPEIELVEFARIAIVQRREIEYARFEARNF